MINLRITRGPLLESENETILKEYNRLTSSQIPLEDFRRWVQNSPDGPVYHALLETDDGEIAGHFCLIPMRAEAHGTKLIAAKAEYFYLREQFRKASVRTFEDSFKPPAVLLLDQLYKHCRALGWGPFFASADRSIHPLHMMAGCRPVDFALHECLFILKPLSAARYTPNLKPRQRLASCLLGAAQKTSSILSRFHKSNAETIPVNSGALNRPSDRIELFLDGESVRWRYPENQYLRVSRKGNPYESLVAKQGTSTKYVRVADCQQDSEASIRLLASALVEKARADNVLGVRWAVFGDDQAAARAVSALRASGFYCAPRVRRILMYSVDQSWLSPAAWRLSDSLFCFDL